jgi:SAM-dependent methyltransferase
VRPVQPTGDPGDAVAAQYQNSANLNARASLHERYGSGPPWQRWVFDQIDLRAGQMVLEVGCGPGNLWRENAERLPWAAYVLTDRSRAMAVEARRSTQPGGAAFESGIADVKSLPFGDACFDVAIANHMLYHVPDLEAALSELKRVVKPEGRFVAATNGAGHMREVDALISRHLTLTGRGSMVTDFSLESGSVALRRHFADVALVRHPPAPLLVTEAGPIVDYVRSREDAEGSVEAWRRLEEEVAREIARSGRFLVTRDTGLFLCSR